MKNLFKNKKNRVILLLSVIGIIAIIIGVSYAFILFTATQQDLNKVSTDCINVDLVDDTDAITLNDAYPMSDDEGKNTKPYRFTLTNTCHVGVDYSVNLEVLSTSEITSKDIGARLDGNNIKALNAYESKTPVSGEGFTATESYSLGTGTLKPGESKTHSVRIWLYKDAGNDTQNKHFDSKVIIEAVQNQLVDAYKEDILHGADPVLGDNLIPVRIADDGTVTKANIETEWYNYENQQWANAVILVDKGQEYNNYDVIPESNIESYFVWIPKYKYKLFNLGENNDTSNYENQLVDIQFGLTDTKDVKGVECATPLNDEKTQAKSGDIGNCSVGEYMTHPAFITMQSNGLWVGKFETGYKGATSKEAAQQNTSEYTNLQIKPDVYSWRNIQISNAYQVSSKYQTGLDSHMMKNTEWGAVAILQNSKYGSHQKVRKNGTSDHKTGYAIKNAPTTGFSAPSISCTTTPNACNEYGLSTSGVNELWNTNIGVLASTTGNISGIYDMSGGSQEYVMGVLADESGNPMSGISNESNSGFSGKNSDDTIFEGIEFPNKKYYDLYKYGTADNEYNRHILGDAIGEFGYSSSKTTIYSETCRVPAKSANAKDSVIWIYRGHGYYDGINAGILSSYAAIGSNNNDLTFRVVLAPR